MRIALVTGNAGTGLFEIQLSWAQISDEERVDSKLPMTACLLRARFSTCLFQIRFDP